VKPRKTPRPSVAKCSERLKIIADPTRLAVLRFLMTKGPHTVAELNRRIDIEQSLLSHHLQVLRAAGMVKNVRDGKSVRYELAEGMGDGDGLQVIDLGCCALSFRS
jgi:ArsR family transcriptional regulator